jgi:hypothetical protein
MADSELSHEEEEYVPDRRGRSSSSENSRTPSNSPPRRRLRSISPPRRRRRSPSPARSRSRSRSPLNTGSGSEDSSWSSGEDDRKFAKRFEPVAEKEDHKAPRDVCDKLGSLGGPTTFHKPAVLGMEDVDINRQRDRTAWREYVEMKLECKSMPCSRVGVEVWDGTLPMTVEALVDEREKYRTRPKETGFPVVQRSAALLRTAHEVVSLFKKVRM